MDDLTRLGIERFNSGRFDSALRCFRAAVDGGARGPETRCLLAHVLDASGRAEEAVAEFVSVLEDFPRHEPAYAGLASLILRRGAHAGARAALRGALVLTSPGTLRLCARAAHACGDLEAAEEALRKALRLAHDEESRRLLLQILRAREQACLAAGLVKPAEKALREALALEPRNKESLRRLIGSLRRRALALISAGRLAEAEKALRRALARAPRDKESRRRLAELLLMREREKQARLKKAERIRLLHRHAEAFITAGRLGPAAAALRKALLVEPGDAQTRRRLAEVLLMGEFKRYLTRVPDGSPKAPGLSRHGSGRLQLARLAATCAREQLARGQVKAARRSLRRALALHPRGPASRSSRIALLRLSAAARTAAGHADKAEQSLRRALRLSPKNTGAREDLAAVLRARAIAQDIPNTRGRFRRARRAWLDVSRMDPRDGAAFISLSLLARWIGRPDQERSALRRAVAPGRELSRADRFKALMRLGRCAEAVRLAETIIDAGAALPDLRAFCDPWERDNRPDREAPQTDLAALSRALRTAPGPWRGFYLGSLGGPKGLGHFDALPAGGRYRWMHYNAAMEALFSGRFRRAVRSFHIALRHEPMDWRAHGYLSEAYACIDEPARARAQMARGLAAAPGSERAQVYAWWGELELWLGGYARALALTTRACAMGAPFAHGWKGAALLKLGRREEALAQLDAALRLYPNDEEARLWRAEAKRELGRGREALEELKTVTLQHWVWVLFNRALAKRALGDERGMTSDFERLPPAVIAHVRRELGLRGSAPLDPARTAELLEAGLRLARGFRRGEYGQAVWLSRRSREAGERRG